jgi:hypothetical protein
MLFFETSFFDSKIRNIIFIFEKNIMQANLKSYSQKEKIVFLLSIILFFVFLYLRISSNLFFLDDSYDYLKTANLLNSGKYFSPSDSIAENELSTKRPFLFPLFLSLFYGFKTQFVLFVQTMFGIFNVYLMFSFLKKLQLNIPYYFVLFLALTPSIFVYHQLLMSEWLVMTLIMALVNLVFKPFTKQSFFIIQLITILLAFTKPVFYPFIYFNFVYFMFVLIKLKKFTFSIFFPIIILFFYLSFNEYKTNYFHFSSMQNINLIEYNLYYFKAYTTSKEEANVWKSNVYQKANTFKSFKERELFLNKIAKTEIKNNFWNYSFYHFFTSVRGCFDPGRFDLMTYFKKEDGKSGFLDAFHNKQFSLAKFFENKEASFLILFLLMGFFQFIKIISFTIYLWQNKKTFNFLQIYFFSLLIYYVLITGPVSCSRYMMPFQGLFICLLILFVKNTIKLKFVKKNY